MARAIDADELKIKIHHRLMGGITHDDLINWIDEQPTIDTVKHGKWVKDRERDMLRCSACEDFYVDKWLYWYNHCPNCGARMDGE